MSTQESKKFEVGARVTGSDPAMKRWEQAGVVVSVEPELNYWRYFVKWKNGDHREHHGNELKAAPLPKFLVGIREVHVRTVEVAAVSASEALLAAGRAVLSDEVMVEYSHTMSDSTWSVEEVK